MKERISAALKQIEDERECRILLAVESGSRAWGFASPDSDYDVRAAYVKPLDWYLQLEDSKADTISALLPGDLDVVAWDLRKFLVHMKKSNASVLEWLGSPIVYRDGSLLARLRDLRDSFVDPAHVAYHYCSMFRHAMDDLDSDGTVSVKKLCYAIRANLCADWTLAHGTMPPTRFADVRSGLSLEASVSKAIDRLLSLKNEADEKRRVIADPDMRDLLRDRQASLASAKWPVFERTADYPELTRLFRESVKNGLP